MLLASFLCFSAGSTLVGFRGCRGIFTTPCERTRSAYLCKEGKATLVRSIKTKECARALPFPDQRLWQFLPNFGDHVTSALCASSEGPPRKWAQECNQAFQTAKSKLTEAPVLVHFDSKLPLHLAGAVISHVMPDGSEHPIAFMFHSLSVSKRNYSQVEKEAFSLVSESRSLPEQLAFHTGHGPQATNRHATLGIDVVCILIHSLLA